MNRNTLKTYAPQARRDFIAAVTDRAASYGLRQDRIEPMTEQGEVVLIAGTSVPRDIATKRKRLEGRITRHGFEPTMEAIAYTWFNRFAAMRFMELHGYLEHGYRVLSHPDPAKPIPEILEHAAQVELPGLNPKTVLELKLDGTRDPELYRMLVLAQCNALHAAMPFLFERIDDETELLLPENLLHSDSLIRKLVNGIDEEDWQEVEIIGWLYQFYIAEKKDQVIGKVVQSEDIPAATQLFTPNWIVKYLVQNSLGRQWLATYPDSPLKQQMEFYIEPAEQTPDVQAQLKVITPESLNPEELTLLDPACGSGHILVEAYDLFKAIYQERGYRARDIPALILQKNLFGLEIDDRAAQLAAFALMMKARADDRRIFANGMQPHILAIQESKGLNAQQIVESLNRPLDAGETKGQQGNIAQDDVAQLITLFEHGKTFGSLIRVLEHVAEKLPAIAERVQEVLVNGGMLEQSAARSIMPIVEQAHHLGQTYDCVVTNPPYMGTKFYASNLKAFIRHEYKRSQGDLYTCFMIRNLDLARSRGLVGMITIPNWMFLSSFEELRDDLLGRSTIDTFIHNGRGVFGSDFGSCSFVLRNHCNDLFSGSYRRLFEKQGSVADNEELEQRFFTAATYTARQSDFRSIPSQPIAYWISERMRQCFSQNISLHDVADLKKGLNTGDNDRFLRLWTEVCFANLCVPVNAISSKTWFPLHKGGPARRWYGNHTYVINWKDGGSKLRDFPNAVIRNERYYFRIGTTWTTVSSARFNMRLNPEGFIFEGKGSACFPHEISDLLPILGYCNSTVFGVFFSVISPTIDAESGSVGKAPFPRNCRHDITALVSEAVQISREDWDSSEESWDFSVNPIVAMGRNHSTLDNAYQRWLTECRSRTARLQIIEEENNDYWIRQFQLDDELTPAVTEDQITLYRPNREEDIKRLISYAIGCMMGRYSLDKPGLIYAHSGNHEFWRIYHEKHGKHEKGMTTPLSYDSCISWSMVPPDADGIIPLMDTDWFPDDASNRLVEFLSVAWPKEHLAENLTFIADSLGPNRSEQPQETIRRYFATGFYKHHLQIYKRRPIYWLFSSGKQRAFQCLVYLHRYHEGTLARMRTEYVIPLQGKIAARIDQLADDSAAASSTAYRKKLEKERETLRKQHVELQAFDEQLRHYADQRIRLDLDDGVKVNYGKFGNLLAEVKAVTGGTMDDAP